MGLASDVKTYQVFFNTFGYSKAKLGADLAEDGIYGNKSKEVTEYFQKKKNIIVDKVIGPQTRAEMTRDIQKRFNDTGLSWLSVHGKLAEDGIYGKKTDEVTLYLQRVKLLAQDKIMGSVTLKALANYKQVTSTPDTSYVGVNYVLDAQNTDYSCGCSAMQMLFSAHGLYADENWLIGVMKTKPGSGTDSNNLKLGVNAVNTKYGKNFTSRLETFQSWERLRDYIKAGNPPILRISSFLTPGGEHFVLLAGIDIKGNYAILGDPSHSGRRVVSLTELLNKMKKVNVASIFVVL